MTNRPWFLWLFYLIASDLTLLLVLTEIVERRWKRSQLSKAR